MPHPAWCRFYSMAGMIKERFGGGFVARTGRSRWWPGYRQGGSGEGCCDEWADGHHRLLEASVSGIVSDPGCLFGIPWSGCRICVERPMGPTQEGITIG